MRLTCPAAHAGSCDGRVDLLRRGVMGKARYKIARGRTRTVRVPLGKAGAKVLRRLRRVPAVVRLATKQPSGKPVQKRIGVTLTNRRSAR